MLIDLPTMKHKLRSLVARILDSEDNKREFSAYTGSTGIAWALLHVTQVESAAIELSSILDVTECAINFARHSLSILRHDRHPHSLLFGEASIRAALCLSDTAAAFVHHVKQYINLCTPATSPSSSIPDEFLYGRAGSLMGCLIIQKHVQAAAPLYDTIHSIVHSIIYSGRRQAHVQQLKEKHREKVQATTRHKVPENPPLWWEWHETPYLGAAHGSMGILYSILNAVNAISHSLMGPQDFRDIQDTLDYILSLECDSTGQQGHCHGEWPTRMGSDAQREPLMHWCHGAVGAVFLFSQAHMARDAFSPGKGEEYLAAALRAGDSVWRRGLLKKGPGLCHGISGNAYALLRLFKCTRDPKWLYRAVKFAEFMWGDEFELWSREPDHPYSLFEGWAGAVCLYADLMRDDCASACFPLFEVPTVEPSQSQQLV